MSGYALSCANKASALWRSLLFFSIFCLASGLVSIRPAQAQLTDTVLHSFDTSSDGVNPYSTLVQASDGAYYGTTLYGGNNNKGTLFKVDAAGHLTTIHHFNESDGALPYAALIQGQDGSLYGTTFYGGDNGCGTIFQISLDGSVFNTLHSFSFSQDGGDPYAGLVQGRDGMLYGTTEYGGVNGYGTVFQVSTDGTVFNCLRSFSYGQDGGAPYATLVQGQDGYLYGTTYYGGAYEYGTVFQISTDGSVYNVIHHFNNADGAFSYAGLIQGRDGLLYGTTSSGGPDNAGTVFQVSTDGSVYNVLHNFDVSDGYYPYAALIQGQDGYLYSTTAAGGGNGYGTVFQVSTDGSVFNCLRRFDPNTDGGNPYGGVVQGSDGLLHGVTYVGPYATSYNGTIYTIDTSGTAYTIVFDFSNSFQDGQNPGFGTLALGKDGNYYGTTMFGGGPGCGTLYKLTPAGQITLLHVFDSTDGANPYGAVTFDSKGNLYGATFAGGAYGAGTIFEYSPAAGALTTLYNFDGVTTASPTGGVLAQGASLYGTTAFGGQNNYGIVFRLNLPTATKPLTFHVLHSFNGTDGAIPFGNLILGSDKNLYGTTFWDGTNGYGTVFKISPSKGTLTILHNFAGADGANPAAGVIQGLDGMLYGTASAGGSSGYGTVFQLSQDGLIFNSLHSFNGADGNDPTGALLQASDRMLYGTTTLGGVNGAGAVFSLSMDGSVFNSLYSFGGVPGTDGVGPYAGLREGPDGNLYGTTYAGGSEPDAYVGTAYRLATRLPIIKTVSPLTGSASAGAIVKITGVNLTGATVTINGVSQTVQPGASATSLKFTLNPATPTGSYPVVVTTANGVGYSPKTFTVGP